MVRLFATLLIPAALLLTPVSADAGWGQPLRPLRGAWAQDGLPGAYTNSSNGGTCYVYAQRGGYLFINENGSRAYFAYSAPGQLQMTSGQWDPEIVVSPGRDRFGRTVLRFDTPSNPTGYWVSGG